MAIIGSREQLCIHPEVSKKETNFEKVKSRRSLCFIIHDYKCVYVVAMCTCFICVGSPVQSQSPE